MNAGLKTCIASRNNTLVGLHTVAEKGILVTFLKITLLLRRSKNKENPVYTGLYSTIGRYHNCF